MSDEPKPCNLGLIMLDPEPDAPARIDHAPPAPHRPARRAARSGALGLAVGGVAVLLASWAGLAAVGFIDDLFARSTALGVLGLAGYGLGAVLLAVAAAIETRAWRGLARVDRLRAELAAGSLPAAQAAARRWIGGLDLADAPALLAVIAQAPSPEALRLLLRERVSAPLAAAAGGIGQRAAIEGAALVAVLPHPALDGLFAGLRGLRVIREVAALYGLRPGTLAGLALARRVAVTAAGTAGVELVAQGALDQALKSLPLVRHVAEALPGMSVAAYRLYRLAQITAAACDPLAGEPTP